MALTETDDIRVTDADEEILNFDVSDDALERAVPIIGGQATPVTMVFGTDIVGNCACPV
jgi:D-aminopeptidase